MDGWINGWVDEYEWDLGTNLGKIVLLLYLM